MPFPISRTITLAIDASYRQDDVLDEIERGLPSLGANALRRAERRQKIMKEELGRGEGKG